MDNKKIKVKQIRSSIGSHFNQRKNLLGLGLGKIGKTSILLDNKSTQGMIKKVLHLIDVCIID